jgi:hypothetical protein
MYVERIRYVRRDYLGGERFASAGQRAGIFDGCVESQHVEFRDSGLSGTIRQQGLRN